MWGEVVRRPRVCPQFTVVAFFLYRQPPPPPFTLYSQKPTNRDPATLFATDTTLVSVCTRCAPALSELCHSFFFFSRLHGWILICIVQMFALKCVTICLNAFCATVIWSQMRRTAWHTHTHRRAWQALHLLGALAARILVVSDKNLQWKLLRKLIVVTCVTEKNAFDMQCWRRLMIWGDWRFIFIIFKRFY